MPFVIFLFVAIFFLILPFFALDQTIVMDNLNPICATFVILLGIPHGAIDYKLYKNQTNITSSKFFSLYIFTILINAVLWFVVPTISFLFFLIISAYHFGQSQFSNYFNKNTPIAVSFYFSWGLTILSGMLFFNKAEVIDLLIDINDFVFINRLISDGFFDILFYLGLTVTSSLGIYLFDTKKLTLDQLFVEGFTFTLILLSFYLFPILLGFTMYFVILHAFKVMKDEFKYLHSYKIVSSISSFLKIVLPFTIISISGIILLVIAINYEFININITHLLIIIASCITLPHSFVMENFYNKA